MLLVFVSGFRAFWVYVRVVFFLSARECYWFSLLGLGPFGFMSELFFICERMLLVFVSGFRAFWVYVRVVFFLSARECYWCSFLGLGPFGFMSEMYLFLSARECYWFSFLGLGPFGFMSELYFFICERMLLVFASGFRAFWVYVRVVSFLSARECYWFSFLGLGPFGFMSELYFFYLRENAIGFRFWV